MSKLLNKQEKKKIINILLFEIFIFFLFILLLSLPLVIFSVRWMALLVQEKKEIVLCFVAFLAFLEHILFFIIFDLKKLLLINALFFVFEVIFVFSYLMKEINIYATISGVYVFILIHAIILILIKKLIFGKNKSI